MVRYIHRFRYFAIFSRFEELVMKGTKKLKIFFIKEFYFDLKHKEKKKSRKR